MTTVESTSIHSVEYHEDEEVLEIRFHNSKTIYAYFAVPVEVYNEFIKSDSLGRFYAHQIKGYYDSSKKVPTI